MTTSAYFALLAEFGTADIPLERISEKYFGLKPDMAFKRAALNRLPVVAFRAGSQKSPWLVSAADLAKHIDDQRERALKEWEKSNNIAA